VLGQSGQLYRQGRIRHQYRIVRPNGQIRWVDDRKHALYDADGELIQLGGMVSDITEQTLTEEALRRTQKMDAVGQLTGGIAHDFNNILAITQGNLDQLEHQVHGNERALEQVGAIRRSTERGVNLTRQLLGFSRGKAARVALTDINQLIAGMDNLLRRSLTPEVEVERRFEPHLWLTEIDPGDFEDAFLNLILNAKDAMRGRGRLQLETANCTVAENGSAQQPNTPPGDYVKLTVTDNGSGIPVADREHIFEPFFTTKQRGKGTGLGLAMVFGFSKRSGGLISFTSQLGEGTSFQLYLPRARHREESLDEALRRENPVAEAAGGNEKILVVEDERDLLDLAEESLAALGYHVISARNGPQALEILEEEPDIALLFSDVVMPGGMNGYELAERASNRNPEIRILLTSGYISRSATDPELSRLHADLLNKPYTHSELAQRIRNLLTG
jgi:signal transduction histidine kinase